jgi:hypothetical protein
MAGACWKRSVVRGRTGHNHGVSGQRKLRGAALGLQFIAVAAMVMAAVFGVIALLNGEVVGGVTALAVLSLASVGLALRTESRIRQFRETPQ